MSNRSCFTNRWLPLVCTVLGLSAGMARGTVVYDNTSNPTGDVADAFSGTEITLAAGPRYVTQVGIPAQAPADETVRREVAVAILANDGSDFGEGATPGTVIWSSGRIEFTLQPGEITLLEFGVPAVRVPDHFTVLAYGYPGNDMLPRFYPPSVGSARNGVWFETADPFGWDFVEIDPFGAVVRTRGVPAVSTWGLGMLGLVLAIAGTVLIRIRPRALACALSALGVVLMPTPVRSQVQIGDGVRVDVGGGDAAANETSIVASTTDPSVIVAAWNDWRDSPPDPLESEQLIRVGVAVSNNGGASWTDFLVRPAFQSVHEGDPITAYDPRTGAMWVGGVAAVSGFAGGEVSGAVVRRDED